MTSQRKKQTVSIHILPNISKIKDNQRVKFCLLIEYSMRNIFLEKSYIKCDGEAICKLFQKKKKSWAYLWMNSLKIYEVCFYWMPSWGLSKYIETKLQTTCFYLI